MIRFTDVHTEHCCVLHGCKYGEDDSCAVTTKFALQSYRCEACSDGYDGCVQFHNGKALKKIELTEDILDRSSEKPEIDRLIKIFADRGFELTEDQAYKIWGHYCDFSAMWIDLPDNDNDAYSLIFRKFKEV